MDESARAYDAVREHGWYDNLDRTVREVAEQIATGDRVLDYSAGTGIFAERLLERLGDTAIGLLLVDASPKFLRLALGNLGGDARVAFRRLDWLEAQSRLQRLDEVLPPSLVEDSFDAVVSTNAVHLYFDLLPTFASWRRVVRPDGRIFVQSGNIAGDGVPEGSWIIDSTVEEIHRTSVRLVREENRWAEYRRFLEDEEHMEAHRDLRRRFFPPVRPLSVYRSALEEAGLRILDVQRDVVTAKVSEWRDFLAAYHQGVLGWVGGAEKVTGSEPSEQTVDDRLTLMSEAIREVFEGAEAFEACWTYITAKPG